MYGNSNAVKVWKYTILEPYALRLTGEKVIFEANDRMREQKLNFHAMNNLLEKMTFYRAESQKNICTVNLKELRYKACFFVSNIMMTSI